MRIPPIVGVTVACLLPLACVTGGSAWLSDIGAPAEPSRPLVLSGDVRPEGASPPDWIVDPDRPARAPAGSASVDAAEAPQGGDGEPVLIRVHGSARAPAAVRPAAASGPALAPSPDVYRNTYYDFPSDGPGTKDATIFDAACAPIARVTAAFHDSVCVQGSGRLDDGATVSFARRGCACAALCPRSGQQICFERLDPARFPSGRGAMGRAITPLRTVAVDTALIPLGTSVYIPEYAGVLRPDGAAHDGCFLAEDRGVAVVGQHIDVFTGDPTITARWNAAVPSNRGVHVYPNHPFCVGNTRRP